jgi:poly-gamma-glutamate synthesis protein (capsule biosynthesis protein)
MKKINYLLLVLILLLGAGGVTLLAYNNKTQAESALPRIQTVRTSSESAEPANTNPEPEKPAMIEKVGENHYTQFKNDILAANQTNSSTISIQFFGDIMLDRNVAKNMGKDGLDYVFKNFYGEDKGLYPITDLTVANHEGPYAPARVPTTKSIAFRFDPSLALSLKKYGFTAVSLANNHSLDMGWKNVDFTEQNLDKNNIGHFGNQLKENKTLTWISKIPGKKDQVAFIGLNNTDHPLDMPKVYEAIKDAKQHSRYVIVFMHWGIEYKNISNDAQRNLAHLLIDKGVDAVIGAHPHVVEEAEIYKNKPIFYSLGNFIFDQYFSEETQEGLSVGLILQDGRVKNVYIFPFYGVKSQVQLMEKEKRDKFLDWFNGNSRLGGKKFVEGKMEM